MMLDQFTLQTSVVGLTVFLIIIWLMSFRKYRNMPPGPPGWPLVGNLLREYLKLRGVVSFRQFYDWSKIYGPVITVQAGTSKLVVLNNIEAVLEALVKQGSDFASRARKPSLDLVSDAGRSVALGEYGPTWKLHRKLSSKALRLYMQGEQLERSIHVALEKTFALMDKEREPYDPAMYLNMSVVNIISGMCFAQSYDIDDPEFCRIVELMDKILHYFANSFYWEDFIPGLTKWPTKKYKGLSDSVGEFVYRILKGKFQEHKSTFDKGNIRDLTDVLILASEEIEEEEDKEEEDKAAENPLDDRHLLMTISDMYVAGIDTSRISFNYALIHMAANPDIQTKVQTELDSVLEPDELPCIEHRPRMCYTEAVLHESMRLASILPNGLPHKTLRDTKLFNYDIPAGTDIVINHWALHHDTDKWTDVDKFIPERFLDADGKLGPKPESWLPFSAGRRVCLGESVAKPELHLLFAAMMHRYTWRAPEGKTVITKGNETFSFIFPIPQKLVVTKRFK